MKEQYRPIELTNTGALPTLKAGDVFMDSGVTERPQVGYGAVFEPRRAPAAGYERFPETLKNPELQGFAREFSLKTALRPISRWSRTDLFDEFNKLSEIELKALESEESYRERAKIAGMGWLYRGMLNNGLHAVDDREGIAPEDRAEFSPGYISIPPSLEKTLGSFIEAPNEPDAREFIRDFMARVAEKPLSFWSQAELARLHESVEMLRSKMTSEGQAQGSVGRREAGAHDPVASVLEQEIENRRAEGKLQEEEWKKAQERTREKIEKAGYNTQIKGFGPGAPGPVAPAPPAGGGPSVDPRNFAADAVLHDIATEVYDAQRLGRDDMDFIERSIRFVGEARVAGRVNPVLARSLTQLLDDRRRQLIEEQKAQRFEQGVLTSRLTDSEKIELSSGTVDQLQGNVLRWLEGKFDYLYLQAVSGAVVDSPIFGNLRSSFEDAKTYLSGLRFLNDSPQVQADKKKIINETIPVIEDIFNTIYNNILMTARMSFKEIKSAQDGAAVLKTHNLLNGFAMERGAVAALYSRIDEYIEHKRLEDEFHHVDPEWISQAYGNRSPLIKEQLDLAAAGVGPFKGLSVDARSPAIIRALRTAYDVWVNTQRQAVIVTRGRRLEGYKAYLSDPVGPLTLYNIIDFHTDKWDHRAVEALEFEEAMEFQMVTEYLKHQKDLGHAQSLNEQEKLDLGKRLFRDFIAMPDFFSTEWRIRPLLESLQMRAKFLFDGSEGDRRVDNMGLFLQLQLYKEGRTVKPGDKKDKIDKRNNLRRTWEKIATYQQDEIMRLFQDRVADDPSGTSVGNGAYSWEKKFSNSPQTQRLYRRFAGVFRNDVFRRYSTQNNAHGIRDFKDFKAWNQATIGGQVVNVGAVLNGLRQEGYLKFEQIDFSQPQQAWVRNKLVSIFGAQVADDIQTMYGLFKTFSQESVTDLMYNYKFEDTYTRALKTDDALLQEIEPETIGEGVIQAILNDPDDPGIRGLVRQTEEAIRAKIFRRVSTVYSSDAGGDAYVRVWGDTAAAKEAIENQLLNFINAESTQDRIRIAQDLSKAVKGYNGTAASVKASRFTMGTHMILSTVDLKWDVLGISHPPFRILASGLQRIYGPHGEAMNQDDRRALLDQLRSLFIATAGKLTEAELRLPSAEQKRLLAERIEDAKDYWYELEELCKVRKIDIVTKRGMSLIVYLFLAVFAEGWGLVDPLEAFTVKKK